MEEEEGIEGLLWTTCHLIDDVLISETKKVK
jgi:hypothetical protein